MVIDIKDSYSLTQVSQCMLVLAKYSPFDKACYYSAVARDVTLTEDTDKEIQWTICFGAKILKCSIGTRSDTTTILKVLNSGIKSV